MKTGMLWFDNDPKTVLQAKVERAAEYYRQKYGSLPNVVMVHPSMLTENSNKDAELEYNSSKKIKIRPYSPVLPGHLWIGVEDQN